MSFRKLLLAGAALVASTAAVAPANASIVDRPHFKVLGVVIVWAAEEGTGNTPIATDFIINDQVGGGDTDLIGGTSVDGRTVVTGSLTPTADSSSTTAIGDVLTISDGSTTIGTITPTTTTFNSFDVTNADLSAGPMEYNSSFYVASNTAFSINGSASTTTTSGDFELADIGYSLGVTVNGTDDGLSFGSNAQDPNGTFPTFANLAALSPTPVPVFNGNRRTAASTGSIVDQSVRFDATYTLGAGGVYDLSQGAGEIEAAVVYTVFVP